MATFKLPSSILRDGANSYAEAPPSPVPHLIGTNRLATDLERGLIRDVLADIDSQLTRLDNESSRAPTARRRDHLRSSWAAHKRLLSPVLRCPHELMAEIFLLSLPEEWQYDYIPIKRLGPGASYRAAVLTGMVCKFWRDVALATPKLWSKISLRLWRPEQASREAIDRKEEMWIGILEAWLKRSAQTGVAIHLRCPQPGHVKETTKDIIITQLSAHAHRWQEIYTDIMDDWVLKPIYDNWDCVPSLRSVKISLTGEWSAHPPGTHIYPMFAPNLQALDLRFNALSHWGIRKTLPWAQLTKVRLDGKQSDVNACFEYLRLASNLSHLHLICSPTPSNPFTAMLHSQLQVLHLESDHCYDYLAYLTLPNLYELHCTFAQWPHAEMVSFLSRSSCCLQSCKLRLGTTIIPADFVEFVKLVPALNEMAFHVNPRNGISSAIFKSLTFDARIEHGVTQHLLPRLEKK